MKSRMALCEKNFCNLQNINQIEMWGGLYLCGKMSCVHLPLFHSLYLRLFQLYQFIPMDLQTLDSQFRMQWVVSDTSFYIELTLYLLAFVLALSKVNSDFVKAKCVGFFSYFDFITPALTPCQLQTPHSIAPDKINWAKLEAESFSPSLPSHHLETTHLGSVFDLRSFSQVIWICLIVANGPEVGHF